jgi:hypothetical protein
MNRGGGNRNRPYENTLLNDLHEIMPEALYDSDLFNSPILRFFQQRVGHMFPSYHRERGLYLRDQADSRRHAFRSTRLSRMPNPVVQPLPVSDFVGQRATPVVQTYESNVSESFLRGLLLSIMAENATQASITPPTPPVATSSAEDDDSDTAEGERIPNAPSPLEAEAQRRIIRRGHSGISVTIPGGARWWDPVAVRPSAVAYSRNTILMDSSGVPAGTVCTVCQSAPGEDLSGVPITETMWRKLRGCQHYFHKICADRWFEQNIHCPNCRADIRTVPQVGPTEGTDTLNV